MEPLQVINTCAPLQRQFWVVLPTTQTSLASMSVFMESSFEELYDAQNMDGACFSVTWWLQTLLLQRTMPFPDQWKSEDNQCFLNIILSAMKIACFHLCFLLNIQSMGLYTTNEDLLLRFHPELSEGCFYSKGCLKSLLVRLLVGNCPVGSHSLRHLSATATRPQSILYLCYLLSRAVGHRHECDGPLLSCSCGTD